MSRGVGALLVLAGVTACGRGAGRTVRVYDPFEGPALSSVWETSRLAPGSVVIESQVVRAGRSAARIVLRPRDTFEAAAPGDVASERDELLEAQPLVSRQDVTYEYAFSLFLPSNFPIVRRRLVLAQWKQDCRGAHACSNDAPILALRYVGGILAITRTVEGRRDTLFTTRDEMRGRWTDLRFRLRFAHGAQGRVQAWLDGRQVVDVAGVTANAENDLTGYRAPGRFYFKMGLYRDLLPFPETLYVDEYRKTQLPDSASPPR